MADMGKKVDSSNYYRILGTNSNAGSDLIKKRYLEKLKHFPPEKEPEEFKRIRKAYETLKDPFDRSQYDLKTKYQGKAQRLMDKAIDSLAWNDYDKAEQLINGAMKYAAKNLYLLKVKAHVVLKEGSIIRFHQIYEKIIEIAPNGKRLLVLKNKVMALIEEQYYDKALQSLNKIVESSLEDKENLFNLYFHIYHNKDQFNEIWKLFIDKINYNNNNNINDDDGYKIYSLILSTIINYGKWDKKKKYMEMVKTYFDKLDKEAQNMVIASVEEDYSMYKTHNNIPGIEIYHELLLYLQHGPEDRELKEAQLITSIREAIEEMANNDKLFPYVFYKTAIWFMEWAHPECETDLLVRRPSDYMMADYKKDYMGNKNSIKIIKREYPLVYQQFEDKYTKMFNEMNNYLNARQKSIFKNQKNFDEKPEYIRKVSGQIIKDKDIGRNDPCPCGSGKKYKKCCGR